MTDQRDVKRRLHRLEQIKTWQLIVLFVLMAFVSATFLRLNNIGMIERREAVIAADKAGDDYVTQNRLVDLQAYAVRHMNASTGDIYLVEKYNRDIEAAARQARDNPGGPTIYAQADEYCRQRIGGYSQTYVQCVYERIAQLPAVDDPGEQPQLPNPALYRHNFASQGWSPDFAGWSLLLTGVIALLIVIRGIMYLVLRALLRARYRRN